MSEESLDCLDAPFPWIAGAPVSPVTTCIYHPGVSLLINALNLTSLSPAIESSLPSVSDSLKIKSNSGWFLQEKMSSHEMQNFQHLRANQ